MSNWLPSTASVMRKPQDIEIATSKYRLHLSCRLKITKTARKRTCSKKQLSTVCTKTAWSSKIALTMPINLLRNSIISSSMLITNKRWKWGPMRMCRDNSKKHCLIYNLVQKRKINWKTLLIDWELSYKLRAKIFKIRFVVSRVP